MGMNHLLPGFPAGDGLEMPEAGDRVVDILSQLVRRLTGGLAQELHGGEVSGRQPAQQLLLLTRDGSTPKHRLWVSQQALSTSLAHSRMSKNNPDLPD